ncbi:hypothetical protein KKH23_08915 [Patescibacteria group bacterium]|uniref:Uncharacterized protein n=1 Tax=viral metagenome TaxID=1070528 RepID=A0A6M3MFU3_9ZZZZ|nr:hypothetical protein [Patescibacteria group bacterium]
MSSPPKRIIDEEFLGWQFYNTTDSGYEIYQAPDSLEAAMVDPTTREILFLMDRGTGEKLYQHPNVKKFAKMASALRLSKLQQQFQDLLKVWRP